jgi:serine/threonine-protein kinase
VKTFPKAGRYELLEELGRGAMGVVYKANDPVIGRDVAVKTMRLSEAGTGLTREELTARFQTEARAAGLLSHPNIVVVYDAGEEDGLFYITMEYVEGRSLQALLDARQSFPLPRALRLMDQACSALEYAHQHHVVHRDIKPANLMLTPDDAVKVTDFGTAKILQFGTTQTAHIIGTPSYMSPEQVKGKPADGRSDIFALGVIFYELLTGEKPFPGQNITTVIYKIINEEPIPPRELDSSIHPGLSSVITRALAKEPSARYQSCDELMEALRNYRELGPSPAATLVAPPRGVAAAVSDPARPASASLRAPATPRSAGTELLGQQAPQGKRSSIWLALLLLAIIAGASYRVWPYVREVWQTARPHPSPPVSVNSQLHASNPAQGSAQVSEQPQPAASSQAPAVTGTAQTTPESNATKEKPAEAQPTEAKPGPPEVKAPEPRKLEDQARSKLAEANPRAAAQAEMKSRIEQKLGAVGLGGKVHVRAVGDTFALSGRLTPREHRQLLHLLRDAPAWIHLVDNIEYAGPKSGDESGGDDRPRPAAGRGEIEVLTDVMGALAVLHGPQGQVISNCTTPCRFEELWPGRYGLEVNLAGHRPVRRMLQVRAGSIVDERIQLEAMVAGLYVTTRPPSAHVFINGEPQPEPTPTTIRLGPGTYNIVVRKPGFEPYAGPVQLKGDELTHLDVELAPSRKP